jgi:hypothetical protein
VRDVAVRVAGVEVEVEGDFVHGDLRYIIKEKAGQGRERWVSGWVADSRIIPRHRAFFKILFAP